MTLESVLDRHLALYPGMQAEDAVKLIYQNEFGPAHLLEDSAGFRAALEAEQHAVDALGLQPQKPETIGNAYARVFLSGLPGSLSATTLYQLCLLAAEKRKGSSKQFAEKLRWLQAWADNQHQGAFNAKALAAFLEGYRAAGYPVISHSDRYKALYHPHYRVVDASSALFISLYKALDHCLDQKPHCLVGIDGMSASGKTTLAACVQRVYGAGIIHTDDFFLPMEQRTPEQMRQPGGHMDLARLAAVLRDAKGGEAMQYRRYDCQLGALTQTRKLPQRMLTVVEGAYAHHPALEAAYDVKVFLSVDAGVQRLRIEERNGLEMALRFSNEWIPRETDYFSAFGIRENSDIILDTSTLE